MTVLRYDAVSLEDRFDLCQELAASVAVNLHLKRLFWREKRLIDFILEELNAALRPDHTRGSPVLHPASRLRKPDRTLSPLLWFT